MYVLHVCATAVDGPIWGVAELCRESGPVQKFVLPVGIEIMFTAFFGAKDEWGVRDGDRRCTSQRSSK